jgi:hypothetical protein
LAVFDGSSLGVEETISLFQRAIMVIGPHGAGLTNMLWTREATKVVEFLHMSYPLLCYWHMASGIPFRCSPNAASFLLTRDTARTHTRAATHVRMFIGV